MLHFGDNHLCANACCYLTFSYELERISEVSSCNEEMLELKQLEIQSLEKQIAILQDVSSTTPLQRRDSIQDTQLTIKSLQEEINRLQGQLAVSVLLQGFSVFFKMRVETLALYN